MPDSRVFLARSPSLQDLGLLVCKRRTTPLHPPGCWKSDLRTQDTAWPAGGSPQWRPPRQPGEERRYLWLRASLRVSLLLGARQVCWALTIVPGKRPAGQGSSPERPWHSAPSQEAPIPSHTVGRGPESQRWQSAVGQVAWGAETKGDAADQHLYSGSTQSGSEAYTVCTPHMPATDSYACIPSGCH